MILAVFISRNSAKFIHLRTIFLLSLFIAILSFGITGYVQFAKNESDDGFIDAFTSLTGDLAVDTILSQIKVLAFIRPKRKSRHWRI